ncbi:MAG: hypothetical protein WBE38_08515 [Terracidiphilus sp.]
MSAQISVAESAKPSLYLDPMLPKEQRAANLVSRMTIDEKVSGMTNGSAAVPRANLLHDFRT